jgi:Family of unknown function (DUF5990)
VTDDACGAVRFRPDLYRGTEPYYDRYRPPYPEALFAARRSPCYRAVLVGRLGLTDDKGWPLCAAVRPPRIHWSTEPS